jgi:hypothetical protein
MLHRPWSALVGSWGTTERRGFIEQEPESASSYSVK